MVEEFKIIYMKKKEIQIISILKVLENYLKNLDGMIK